MGSMKLFRLQLGIQTASAAILLGLLAPVAAFAENEVHISNEFSLTANDIHGPGSRQSSLTQGTRYLDVLNIFGNGRQGDVDYNFTIGGKTTDDRSNDPTTWSLTNLQGRFTNRIHTLTLGDTFESFSQYALNTAIKGSSYKYSRGGYSPELTFLYGIAYPRWDNIWGTKTVERQVLGGKIKQAITDELWIGFSGVKTTDHNGNVTTSLYDGNVFTGDWEYRPIPGLTIRGESSFSSYGEAPTAGPYHESNGYAHKVEAVGDADPSRVSIEYERVSPDYLTIAGSATPDREKFKTKWRYKHNKDLTMNLGFLWFRDNLDGQKIERTDRFKPEASIMLKRFMSRQYAVADLSYKLDIASGATDSTDHIVNLNYRDRFGVLDSDSNFGMTFYDTRNSRRTNEFTYNTTLSSRHTVGPVILKPGAYLGGWTSSEELAAPKATDQIFEYSASLGVDIPEWKVTSNFKLGENRLIKETANDTTKIFAQANIFWKPDLLAKAQGMLFARGYVNNFNYQPQVTPGAEDFRESSLTVGLNMQY